ncbi:MAG TPA: nucleotide exchange factor GrpE, partial [Phormidium sp.]
QEFQQQSLQILESWLIQWPRAAYAAQQNPEAPAVKLLPLLRPVEQLLREWGVEAIASVGAELPFDPQQHQLIKGTAQPGDTVKVTHIGYRQGDKLLHRAKVEQISSAK